VAESSQSEGQIPRRKPAVPRCSALGFSSAS